MTTETTAPEAAPDDTTTRPASPLGEQMTRPVPNWQREDFLPEAPTGDWSWPAYTEARDRHVAAAQALAAARQDGDAEQEAFAEVCDSILDGLPALRVSMAEAESAFEAARQGAIRDYPDGVIPDSEREAHADAVRAARKWVEPDMRAMRKVLRLLERDTFYPPDTDRPVPSLEAKVRQAVR